ncbi:MAG TPA: hypothetical protein VLY24_30130 [Bryobacteraceae bacterium]|nr:hypothetical protein [Bryobacteraceae bacterium]
MKRVVGCGLWVAGLTGAVFGQAFTQRGFLETDFIGYPQTAPNDSGQAIGEALFRYEAFYKLNSAWQFAGGIDARADTHRQVDRAWEISWDDRERRRPAFGVRQLNATYSKKKLTVVLGKQFIRWGKADILNPTDRFAPQDYLTVVDSDFLGITAARATYGGQSNTVDVVWAPLFTPSRIPLLDQRWSNLPPGIALTELRPSFPGGSQFGARWNHIGAVAEYSLSFYDGHNNLPVFNFQEPEPLTVDVERYYPQMRMYGGDAAVPLSLLTLKAEAAYFTSTTAASDEYVLYVVQLERQSGEWSFVGGYTGEALTRHGSTPFYSPERGFARAVTGLAGYTIDTNRSLTFEGVVRQNGQGVFLEAKYSQAWGQHWRATAGIAWIHGADSDFLGQYHRNSYGILGLRYSF